MLDKNDSPPVFKDMASSLSVSEELAVGQTVTTIKAVDPDTLGQLTYSLVSGDDTKRFQLDSVTGELRLKEPLDRETADTYKVKVRASDGLQFQETTLTIKVGIEFFKTFLLLLFSCMPLVLKFPGTQKNTSLKNIY